MSDGRAITNGSGQARELANLLVSVADATPTPDVARATRQRLLHAVGVGLVSTQLSPPATALEALSGETGSATILGSSNTRSPGAAAFVNAVAMHSSLQEDCGPGGYREGSHPGVYIVPAALAAAEITQASGAQLIRGLITGYETAGRIGAAIPGGLVARRYRPVGIIGPFGATAAAATVLGADSETVARALSIAANLAAGTGQGFVSGGMEPFFHAGYSARNGLLAAQLAIAGAPAAPDALEGEHGFFAIYGGDPGHYDALTSEEPQLAIERLGSKKYAACLQNQESIELACELREVLGEREIASISLERPVTPENGIASPGVGSPPPYNNMLQRQMAARFTAAAALLGRDVRDPLYFQTSDPEATSLSERISLRTTDASEITITVVTTSGAEFSASGRRQSILTPSFDEAQATFLGRASRVLGCGRAHAVLAKIMSLPEIADVTELTLLLRP